MAADPYDDILNQAKDLPVDKLEQLLNELSRAAANGNGDKRSVGERWRERGFIGIIKEGPEDLSTNPKHMEGFGEDAD